MRAIHIDDERDSLDVMRMLLQQHCPQVELVASVTSVDEGLAAIKEHQPQLVFLDIEMPGKNGFVLLDELKDYTFDVVMVTGYENYAIKAIKYSALDYLLKPIDGEDLVEVIKKAQVANTKAAERLGHFRSLASQDDDTYSSLMIASTAGYKSIDIRDLVYLKSESGSYCVMHFADGSKELVSKSLSHFENLLPEDSFCRVHRSHIINIKKVKEYNHSTSIVTMVSGVELTVSNRKKGDFRKKIAV